MRILKQLIKCGVVNKGPMLCIRFNIFVKIKSIHVMAVLKNNFFVSIQFQVSSRHPKMVPRLLDEKHLAD